jgi:hypothetical protein
MERYLVELTGDHLDRLNGMVREAINAAERANKGELENLLAALHDIRRRSQERLISYPQMAKENPGRPACQLTGAL